MVPGAEKLATLADLTSGDPRQSGRHGCDGVGAGHGRTGRRRAEAVPVLVMLPASTSAWVVV